MENREGGQLELRQGDTKSDRDRGEDKGKLNEQGKEWADCGLRQRGQGLEQTGRLDSAAFSAELLNITPIQNQHISFTGKEHDLSSTARHKQNH